MDKEFLIKPKKYLGQNFLKSGKDLNKIARALKIELGNIILEIGAGSGNLTKKILEQKPKKLIAIEKDKELVEILERKFIGYKNLKIINEDFLKLSIPKIIRGDYKIIGNIPYNISGKILRKLVDSKKYPELIVLTLQKELAQRITSKPPKMNLLAAIVQRIFEANIAGFISKQSFWPKPKVDSAILRLTPINRKLPKNFTKYADFVKILFSQPRKTLLNNLCDGLKRNKKMISKEQIRHILQNSGINPNNRPQNLSTENINKLANQF